MTGLLWFAFAIAIAAAGTSAAFAQEPVKPAHSHHRAHHPRHPAKQDAVRQAVPVQAPPSANSIFKPYAHPGEGDDDGISTDPDDCMKGCIGGNPG